MLQLKVYLSKFNLNKTHGSNRSLKQNVVLDYSQIFFGSLCIHFITSAFIYTLYILKMSFLLCKRFSYLWAIHCMLLSKSKIVRQIVHEGKYLYFLLCFYMGKD